MRKEKKKEFEFRKLEMLFCMHFSQEARPDLDRSGWGSELDIAKNIRLIPKFSESEVEKYFLSFEKTSSVASKILDKFVGRAQLNLNIWYASLASLPFEYILFFPYLLIPKTDAYFLATAAAAAFHFYFIMQMHILQDQAATRVTPALVSYLLLQHA